MGRPVYPYELNDPDFSWLIDFFNENHSGYSAVVSNGLPVVFVSSHDPREEDFASPGEGAPPPQSESKQGFDKASEEPAK
jgi:hypothetical protein